VIDPAIRELVRDRAGHRCEYCQLRQEDLPFSTFQVEHIIPRKHGGADDPDNLALACDRCNLSKGTNLAGIDPETGELTALFNPRTLSWDEHFRPFRRNDRWADRHRAHHGPGPQHERGTARSSTSRAQPAQNSVRTAAEWQQYLD
jgi:hypothetical protein